MFAEVLYNEKELLVLIEQGDEVAFATLFNHYRNRVYSIALKLSCSSSLAEEAVQDVFLKIWLRRADLGHVQSFSAYLFTIVQNTMYKTLRQIAQKHQKRLPLQPEELGLVSDPELELLDREYHNILQKGIQKLPAQQKQVYQLIREKGLKRGEVASLLNLQPDTVKYHLSKAVKNLWSYCRLHLPLFIGFALAILSSLFVLLK